MLFEAFVKKMGQKIDKKDFKNLKKGTKVLYMGFEHEVIDSDGIILKLKDTQSGKLYDVNYNMFNKAGVIEEGVINEGINDPGILKAFLWLVAQVQANHS